jgi:hypothetical protein
MNCCLELLKLPYSTRYFKVQIIHGCVAEHHGITIKNLVTIKNKRRLNIRVIITFI